jgi:DNA-binding transcriptional LysR family regulator
MSTSIVAAVQGFGYGWYPEDKIRPELDAGTLKPLPMREGGERFIELYLVYANREDAGPGTLRLAEIIRERTSGECERATAGQQPASPERSERRRSSLRAGRRD